MRERAHTLPISKYHQVYLVLLEQLQDGRHGDGLPGEMELARDFGVGRVTVRRALEQLAQEGRIVRENGRRSRPAPRAPGARGAAAVSPAAEPLQGLLANIVSVSRGTTVKVIEWRAMPATAELAAALQLPEGDKVRKAVRRRSTAAGPLSYITTYVPEFLVRGFGRAELASKPILELLQAGGVQPGRAVQSISARQADIKVAAELQVPVGAALLWVRRLVHDVDDRPVQLLHGLYRPDRYEYRMELSEVGGIEARIVANEILS
ncbi:GntR family transcriptional regulator [Ramlibacter alkalitolerans]|uniref:GntR family transcriptional regulator n=1 Tax=Ramlibacter alkalitolerans TaxID=2039631 RepID=A0ABS1JLW0_9BURK|nr:GntR family transcriptional regulator [Ramlibacter alkalitolerans]MBL0425219.1 GntR family transcriptional regulator [Ramlibacter alkalitolerans]